MQIDLPVSYIIFFLNTGLLIYPVFSVNDSLTVANILLEYVLKTLTCVDKRQ